MVRWVAATGAWAIVRVEPCACGHAVVVGHGGAGGRKVHMDPEMVVQMYGKPPPMEPHSDQPKMTKKQTIKTHATLFTIE